eukprot:gene42698-52970_t
MEISALSDAHYAQEEWANQGLKALVTERGAVPRLQTVSQSVIKISSGVEPQDFWDVHAEQQLSVKPSRSTTIAVKGVTSFDAASSVHAEKADAASSQPTRSTTFAVKGVMTFDAASSVHAGEGDSQKYAVHGDTGIQSGGAATS